MRVNVLDVYDHYAWRWWLNKDPIKFGKPLDDTDAWQNRFLKGDKIQSPELGFWMNSISSVVAHAQAPHTSIGGANLEELKRAARKSRK